MSKMKTDTEPYSQSKVLQLHRWQRQIFSDTISQIPGMTGEARDAVSAYSQVNMVDASKLLQVPEAHCPEIWIRISPCQRPQKIKQNGRSCGSYCKEFVRSPTGGPSLGKEMRRGAVQEWIRRSTDMRMSKRATKTLVCSYQSTWFGKRRTSNPGGNVARRLSLLTIDRPSAFGVHAERSKGGLSSSWKKKLNCSEDWQPQEDANEKNLTKEGTSSRKITAWSYDMRGHAEKFGWEIFCESAKKDVSSLQQVAAPCVDDHPIPPNKRRALWCLYPSCAEVHVLGKNRETTFASVSAHFGKVRHKVEQSLWKNIFWAWSLVSIRHWTTVNFVMWEIKLETASLASEDAFFCTRLAKIL